MTTDPLAIVVAALREIITRHTNAYSRTTSVAHCCDMDRIAREALAALSAPAAVGDSAERAVNAAESKRLTHLAANADPKPFEKPYFCGFIENVIEGKTYFRTGEYYDLIADLEYAQARSDMVDSLAAHIRKLEKEIEGRG